MSITLNKEQEKAADLKNGIFAIIAVPGSGKTLTMTHRIKNLVQKHGVAPESILGLTFTRNAAESMRDKLAPVLNELSANVTSGSAALLGDISTERAARIDGDNAL